MTISDDTVSLGPAAIDHLWHHNRGWKTATRDDDPLVIVEAAQGR